MIDPRIRLPKTAGIQLFRAIKPMLASRVSKARVVETMKGKFAIETKYDGERIQVSFFFFSFKIVFFSCILSVCLCVIFFYLGAHVKR